MASRTRWYLEQAREFANQAVDGYNRLGADWAKDPVSRAGLTHLVEAVAEYIGHVPDDVRAANPDVPWKSIAGIRTIAAHTYHAIDDRVVEATIRTDLPALLAQIERMLGTLDDANI